MDGVLIVLLVAMCTGFIALAMTVFYGAALANNPRVVELRRATAWYIMRFPWPIGNTMPALLPFGLGILTAQVGRTLAGRSVTLEGFPGDLGQDVLLVGLALVGVAFWFWLRPPAAVLPAWYRDALARQKAGLEPSIPPPRTGPTLTITPRQRTAFLTVSIAMIVATPVFSLPSSVAVGALFGLAMLASYSVRRR